MTGRKNKKWLNAVGQIQFCVLCGTYCDLQVAHRNEGKGMGLKNPDCLTARLCLSCHNEIDNGRDLDKSERRAMMDKAIVLTLQELVKNDLVKVA